VLTVNETMIAVTTPSTPASARPPIASHIGPLPPTLPANLP
jgi:hypothetical protein